MVFKSKYVFESKRTKQIRYIKSAGIVLLMLFLTYSFVCSIMLLDARNEFKIAKSEFLQTPPDLIVVFTGGPKRIDYAIQKARDFKQPNVFITGVNEKNSIKAIAPNNTDGDHIDLDYKAKNTVENVVSTISYLRNNQGLSKILIISSDYHIMRIKQITQSLKKKDDKFTFFYSPVPSNYLQFRNIKLLYIEAFKILRTKIYFMLIGDKRLVY